MKEDKVNVSDEVVEEKNEKKEHPSKMESERPPNQEEQEQEQPEEQEQQPCGFWFQPHCNWMELIVQILARIFIPLHKMTSYFPIPKKTNSIAAAKECFQKVRNIVSFYSQISKVINLYRWSRMVKCPIVEYQMSIPVRSNILTEWEILDPTIAIATATATATAVNKDLDSTIVPQELKETVSLLIQFPSSLLPTNTKVKFRNDNSTIAARLGNILILDDDDDDDEVEKEGEENLENSKKVIDFATFAMDTPLIIHLHGGGFTVGNAEDSLSSELNMSLCQADIQQQKQTGERNPRARPVIIVSVDYSLAPEFPFPCAIMECLSVVEYFYSLNPQRKIHLSGVSAGGNLAIVTALEALRKYPNSIQSLHAPCPFLRPSADTTSYYTNMYATIFPSLDWLRWSWQAYLELDPTSLKTKEESTNAETIIRNQDCSSNVQLWKQCKWNCLPLRRLIDPSLDALPLSDIIGLETLPTIVAVNRADPLYSEGKEMAVSMKQAGMKNITLFEDNGHHYLGSYLDGKSRQKRIQLWFQSIHDHHPAGKS